MLNAHTRASQLRFVNGTRDKIGWTYAELQRGTDTDLLHKFRVTLLFPSAICGRSDVTDM